MMELTTCAFVVTLVSLVTATPYGYGVKGGAGASARAGSSASAGAFGGQSDIPVAIPFGNGFSGSFSKSSSSSSASSSSSSSSSSFSYSGSGAGGFSAQGTHGNIGCTSGSCQNSGGNEISGNHGATNAGLGVHGLNTANAAAVAGSGFISGTDCNGPTCDGNSGKCLSGKCLPKLQPENGYDNSKKCTSGQCGSPSETGPSAATNDDSDDIRFVAHSSKAAHDSKDQSADHDKLTGFSAGSDCRDGNCGTTTSYNSKPNTVHGAPNSYQHSQPSSLPQPNNLNTGSTPGYNTPATDLETPKYDSNCKSGLCNSGQPEPVHGTSPSSYNVPIHGTYDTSRQKPACTDGKCNNQVKGGYYSTTSNTLLTNYLSPQESQSPNGPSYDNPSSKKCGEAGCGSLLSNQVSDRPSVTGATNIHSGLPLSNSVALNPTNCITPNCNPHHIASASSGPNVQPTQINLSGPAHNIKPSNDKLPVYTGGFGAPAGILKPNDYSIPATGPGSPSYTHSSTALNIKPTFGSSPTGCISPNCLGQAPTPGAAQSSSYNTKPSGNVNIPGQKLPTYTGGFGGPAGMLKPNEFNIATPTATKPNHSTSSTYNTPSVSTGCNTPNCIGSSPNSGVTPAVTAQPGSYGIHKESGNVPIATDKTPTYTDGFGGPAGMLKPDEFDMKVTNKPVHSPNPSYQSHPHIPTTSCKTPNCNGYAPVAGANAAANAQSGSYGAAKPSSGVDSSSELPPYTGGFGGPTGVLKPNEFGLPHSAPNSNIPNYSNTLPNNAPTSYNLAGCTTANCYPSNFGSTTAKHPQSPFGATQPSITSHQSGATSPGYTSNFARPVGIANPTAPAVAPISPTYTNTQPLLTTAIHSAGCKTGNCGGQTTSAGLLNGDHPSGSYGPANPNTEPKPYNPQYTAGFGSPSGTVTPNDHSYNVPSPGSSAINCKTANCANVPAAGVGSNAQSDFIVGTKEQLPAFSSGFGASAGSFKPNDYSIPAAGTAPNNYNKPSSVTSSPGACAAGNCDSKVTSPSLPGYNSAPSGSHSSHPYNPQYTGGFGVPAGTATPDDYSHNLPSAGSSSIHCNTPNCAKPAPTTAGAKAQSGYNVDSKEQLPAYTSGFGAPAGLYKPNDHSIPDVGTAPFDQNKPSEPNACSSGNCNRKVTSPSSPGYNSALSGTLSSSQSSNSQYTGNFGSPSGTGSPNDHTYNVPSAASSSIPCRTSNCANPPTANAGANAQSASHAGSKEQLPAYTGGFGAPGGFLKPNDNSIPAVGAAPNVHNKPSPATTATGACSSGNCNSKVPLSSSPGYSPTSSGAHASASSAASAVAYTGGFRGPPGFLKPNDDGKVDLTKIVGGQNQGSHHGAGNIHSPHDLFNASTAGKAGAHSSAGATAYSGSLTSANSGSYGFNTHGAHQEGGVKGTSPCGGGCGDGYQDGLNGGGSSAGAVARSHSSSGAFGIGGSFASSSASAHSSVGAYTKGGYGKR